MAKKKTKPSPDDPSSFERKLIALLQHRAGIIDRYANTGEIIKSADGKVIGRGTPKAERAAIDRIDRKLAEALSSSPFDNFPYGARETVGEVEGHEGIGVGLATGGDGDFVVRVFSGDGCVFIGLAVGTDDRFSCQSFVKISGACGDALAGIISAASRDARHSQRDLQRFRDRREAETPGVTTC